MAYSSAVLLRSFSAAILLGLICTGDLAADSSWLTQASRYLEQLLQTNPDRLSELNEPPLVEFYQARKYRLLWSNDAGRLDRAYDLLHVIINAKDEGLEPSDYYLDDIRRIWDSSGLGRAVELDLLLSAALYRYSKDVHTGSVDARELDQDWHLRIEPLDRRKLLEDVARKSSIAKLLKDLPPPHDGYTALKRQLRHYRELAQQGGWQKLDWGPVLERGVQHAQVLRLRRRL